MKPFSKSDTLSEFSSLERRDNKFEGGELENAAVSRIFDLAFVYIRSGLVSSIYAFEAVSFSKKGGTKRQIEKEQREKLRKRGKAKETKRKIEKWKS